MGLMLQVALLLVGYSLSIYLYFMNGVIASMIVIGFTSFGLLFHLIASATTLSYNYPFQPPSFLSVNY